MINPICQFFAYHRGVEEWQVCIVESSRLESRELRVEGQADKLIGFPIDWYTLCWADDVGIETEIDRDRGWARREKKSAEQVFLSHIYDFRSNDSYEAFDSHSHWHVQYIHVEHFSSIFARHCSASDKHSRQFSETIQDKSQRVGDKVTRKKTKNETSKRFVTYLAIYTNSTVRRHSSRIHIVVRARHSC